MTPALTPDLAVAYVRELSADVRAVVVLDGGGARLAGPEELATPARAYADATAGTPDAVTRLPAGLVLKAATTSHVVVVAAGPLALAGPTALDARTAAEALAGASRRAAGPGGPGAAVPGAPAPATAGEHARQAAEAVLSATQRAF